MSKRPIPLTEKQKAKLPKIFAYGFEKIGFEISQSELLVGNGKALVEFISMSDKKSLDSANGIIIPSGIFEKFEIEPNMIYHIVKVRYHADLMLQREREIINMLQKGGWVCFLVRKIVDIAPDGYNGDKNCNNTDLTKVFMNSFGLKREPFEGSAAVSSKNDEFNEYIKRWGIAKTILRPPFGNADYKTLAKIGNSEVGLEFSGFVFFLPFHTTRLDASEGEALLVELSRSIIDYLQKRKIEIPEWVDEFCFERENFLRNELDELLKRQASLQNELLTWHKYKGILVQSGEMLKDAIVFILEDFFKLNVTDVEDFKEDALIRDDNENVIAVIEIKGTKGGVKRNHINQIDSHRERNELNPSIPGVLIINDHMDLKGISNRLDKTVAEEQILHAKRMNVLIMRTIDLLHAMKILEGYSLPKEKFLNLINQGGGLLHFTNGNFSVV
jgi:hypothetical protein